MREREAEWREGEEGVGEKIYKGNLKVYKEHRECKEWTVESGQNFG